MNKISLLSVIIIITLTAFILVVYFLVTKETLKIASKENDLYFPIIQVNQDFPYMLGAQQEGRLRDAERWFVPNKVYQWSVRWSNVETTQGVYEWPAEYDDNAKFLHERGYPFIIGIKATPEWARLWPGYAASPPAPEYYFAYGAFVQAVIDRYHPIAVEIYNEPDVHITSVHPHDAGYGAWVGDGESYYQGGQRYGGMIDAIIDSIHGAKVLIGALLSHSRSPEFLQGMLDAGARADALSFHSYTSYTLQDCWFDRIFEYETAYRKLTNLPLVVTETGLLTRGNDLAEATPEFLAMQAEYLQYIIERLEGSSIQLVNWYTLEGNGWRNSDLVLGSKARPVYDIWKNN